MTSRKRNFRQRFLQLMTAALLAVGMELGSASAHGPAHGFLSVSPAGRPVSVAHTSGPSARIAKGETRSRPKLSKEEIARRLKFSTCWITDGVHGTGWVVDARQRLVVTNYHVVENMRQIRVYFPVQTDGEWVNDPDYYRNQVKPIDAKLIHADDDADLAVIQLERLPERIVALPLAENSPAQGSQLHTLGAYTNGSSALWTYTFGHVRLVGSGRTALGGRTRIVEAQLDFNKGNSGGPIVNDAGELVAVVEGYRNRGRSGSAVRNVSVAIDIKPVRRYVQETLPLVSPATAEQFVKRGIGYTELERYDAAIQDFTAAIKRNETFAPAYARRALALHLMGDIPAALKDVEQALKLDSTLAIAYQIRGRCRQATQNEDKALSDFSTAIKHEPENAELYLYRGLCLLTINHTSAAHSDFVKASELSPENHRILASRAKTALLLGRHKEAAAYYFRAFKLSRRRSDVVKRRGHEYLNGLGLSLLALKQYAEAAKSFEVANAIYKAVHHKDHWVYYSNLGLALHGAEKFDAAVKAYTKAIELNGNDANLYYLRGKALAEAGRQDLARTDYRKAAQLNPTLYGQLAAQHG